jgi:hypothetical protein
MVVVVNDEGLVWGWWAGEGLGYMFLWGKWVRAWAVCTAQVRVGATVGNRCRSGLAAVAGEVGNRCRPGLCAESTGNLGCGQATGTGMGCRQPGLLRQLESRKTTVLWRLPRVQLVEDRWDPLLPREDGKDEY